MATPQDRISDLPREVQAAILAHLPIEGAIRTSALSRHWRQVWTYTTRLSITFSTNRHPPDLLRFLDHHRVPVNSLQLSVTGGNQYSTNVDSFLLALFKKGGLEHLRIHVSIRQILHLPYFHSLKSLKLFACSITLPSCFNGFPCLTTLKLHRVDISKRDTESLISESKNLTTLKLFARDEPISLVISSSSLKYMNIRFRALVRDARVKFAPCLEKACVFMPWREYERFALDYVRILGDLTGVSSLCLSGSVLECLSRVGVPATMSPFSKLVNLELSSQPLDKIFACLLTYMPCLEQLKIEDDLRKLDDATMLPNDYWENQESFHCLDHCLKRVYFSDTDWNRMNLIRIIRFILLNAKVLQLMKISCCEHQQRNLEGLNQVQMASSDAKFVLSESYCDGFYCCFSASDGSTSS